MSGIFLAISFDELRPYDSQLSGPYIRADRHVYWSDDPTGQVVITFPNVPVAWWLKLMVRRHLDQGPIAEQEAIPPNPSRGKVVVILDIGSLPFGVYELAARVVDAATNAPTAAARVVFEKADKARAPLPFPAGGIPIIVRDDTVSGDAVWPVTAGIPLPPGLVHDASRLAVFEDGVEVPSTIRSHGQWHARGSIRWLTVSFLARWSNGQPCKYSVGPRPSTARVASSLTVTERGRKVVVATGAIRFAIDRAAFAGLEPVTLPPRRGSIVGGPYVVDESGVAYEAWAVPPESFAVDWGAGDFSVTITVAGWHRSSIGSDLCRYDTRITAFAGLAQVHVSHRTILTYDPAAKMLADVGWRFPLQPTRAIATSVDGMAILEPITRNASIGVHQDRSDRCWWIQDETSVVRTVAGAHSDAWFSAHASGPWRGAGRGAAITVAVRDFVERFPKEIEVVDTDGDQELLLHFWPRHGHEAFPVQTPPHPATDQLHRRNIHKLWFAHQGELLDLQFPSTYGAKLRSFIPAPPRQWWEQPPDDRPGGEDIVPAETGKAIGVALGTDFAVLTHRAALPDTSRTTFAQRFRDEPGAVADPTWSERTGVEGYWAARDQQRFPQVERALDGIPLYLHSVIEAAGSFGMWVYGGTHNNWYPALNAPELHRVWQASHYRSVWLAWFLYLRSALPRNRRWARITSDQYLNLGTVHYVDAAIRPGKYVGDLYHCYAFTPWGGPSELWGHFIDPDAHRMRWLLTGDGFARDAYFKWWKSFADLPGAPVTGGTREGAQMMGVLSDRYTHDRDPIALDLLSRLADRFFAYYWDPAAGRYNVSRDPNDPSIHVVWHRQWPLLYHDLTRDPRAVAFVQDWIADGFGELSPNAFLAGVTGQTGLLTAVFQEFLDYVLRVVEDPQDRYNGYGEGTKSNVSSYKLQQAPYFLRALRDAGITSLPEGTRSTYPRRIHSNTNPGYWGVRVFVLVPSSALQFTIRLAPQGYDPGFGNLIVQRWDAVASVWSPVTNDTFTRGVTRDFTVQNTGGPTTLFRIDLESYNAVFLAPLTAHPEVALLAKGLPERGEGRQNFWLGALPGSPGAVIELHIDANDERYQNPTFIAFEEPTSSIIAGRWLFEFAQDNAGTPRTQSRSTTLALTAGVGPWHMYSTSTGGPEFTLVQGADHLFFARDRAHLTAILPMLTPAMLS